jgi:dihydroxyacetone kinase
MTHFVNDAASIVPDALDALVRTSRGELARLDGYPDVKVVLRHDAPTDRVALISGGGAGHEPAHAAFVGAGMLTAAVSGEIFASPSVPAIFAAIMSAAGPAGCLLVVKNYTGDRLNFGLAAEQARGHGRHVEMVVVGDDVALRQSSQPRGLAGTLLVQKIAGAAAEAGADLADVAHIAREVADSVRTLGVSASGVDVPFRPPSRVFPAGRGELGLGIHGEPGLEEIDIDGSRPIVERLCADLDAELDDAPVALLVNSLGGLSNLELGVLTNDLLKTGLGKRAEFLVGPAALMTSLGMRGFSLTALPLTDAFRSGLLAPVGDGVAWPGVKRITTVSVRALPRTDFASHAPASQNPRVRAMLLAAGEALLAEAERLDALDKRVGDGDTGSTFASAARRVRSDVDQLPLADSADLFSALAELVSRSMGGSSGVLLSIMFTAAASAIQAGAELVDALTRGVDAMQGYGGAQLGDRTMLDALVPALDALRATGDVAAAAEAAASGARASAEVGRTRSGRSAYVPPEHLVGVPDPGAEAVAVVLRALART